MKYQTRIIPEGVGYIGQAILNGEVVYTTNVLKDGIMVARELSTFIAGFSQPTRPQSTSAPNPSPPRRPDNLNNNYVPPQRPIDNSSLYQASTNSEQTTIVPANPSPRRCCGRG